MTTYLPLISAFAQRTIFWPPEAFTLDCRVEERIYEWCERTLKENADFLALVNSNEPLDMPFLWQQVEGSAYGGLTECIFHYWLILNWRSHKEGKPFCRQNADWIWRTLKIQSPMAWHAEHPPLSEAEAAASLAALRAAAAAAAAVAQAPEPEPVAGGAGAAALAPLEEPAPEPEPEKDVKVYVTVGNTMYGIRLSNVRDMDEAELVRWYQRLGIASAECWSPEECEPMEIILQAISKRLRT